MKNLNFTNKYGTRRSCQTAWNTVDGLIKIKITMPVIEKIKGLNFKLIYLKNLIQHRIKILSNFNVLCRYHLFHPFEMERLKIMYKIIPMEINFSITKMGSVMEVSSNHPSSHNLRCRSAEECLFLSRSFSSCFSHICPLICQFVTKFFYRTRLGWHQISISMS